MALWALASLRADGTYWTAASAAEPRQPPGGSRRRFGPGSVRLFPRGGERVLAVGKLIGGIGDDDAGSGRTRVEIPGGSAEIEEETDAEEARGRCCWRWRSRRVDGVFRDHLGERASRGVFPAPGGEHPVGVRVGGGGSRRSAGRAAPNSPPPGRPPAAKRAGAASRRKPSNDRPRRTSPRRSRRSSARSWARATSDRRRRWTTRDAPLFDPLRLCCWIRYRFNLIGARRDGSNTRRSPPWAPWSSRARRRPRRVWGRAPPRTIARRDERLPRRGASGQGRADDERLSSKRAPSPRFSTRATRDRSV